jgi:hypothetical protein
VAAAQRFGDNASDSGHDPLVLASAVETLRLAAVRIKDISSLSIRTI